MTDDQIIDAIISHLESRFPKSCTSCGEVYPTLEDYLVRTRRVGDPISFDAEMDDWRPIRPAGTVALSNCACGSTLSIGSAGMPLKTLWRLMWWARGETKRRDISMRALLADLRDEVDERVTGGERKAVNG